MPKQEVETNPQDEDMSNEMEAFEHKASDDNDKNAKKKVIRDKASAILESWSQLQYAKLKIENWWTWKKDIFWIRQFSIQFFFFILMKIRLK